MSVGRTFIVGAVCLSALSAMVSALSPRLAPAAQAPAVLSAQAAAAYASASPSAVVTPAATRVASITPAPASPPAVSTTPASTGGVVKMSDTRICHAPGTTYYDRTLHYTAYPTLAACLAAGGRLPKQ